MRHFSGAWQEKTYIFWEGGAENPNASCRAHGVSGGARGRLGAAFYGCCAVHWIAQMLAYQVARRARTGRVPLVDALCP